MSVRERSDDLRARMLKALGSVLEDYGIDPYDHPGAAGALADDAMFIVEHLLVEIDTLKRENDGLDSRREAWRARALTCEEER